MLRATLPTYRGYKNAKRLSQTKITRLPNQPKAIHKKDPGLVKYHIEINGKVIPLVYRYLAQEQARLTEMLADLLEIKAEIELLQQEFIEEQAKLKEKKS